VSYPHNLSTVPGALLGYRKSGQPILLMAGGSGPPGDPAGQPPASPGGQPPAPGAPPATPPSQPPAPAGQPTQDVASLPDWAQKLITDARGEAAKTRTTAKQTAAEEARQEYAQKVAKALGISTGDDPADPEQLTQQVADYQTEAWSQGVEIHVLRNAAALGINPAAVLDSVSFWEGLSDLQGVGPRDADFAAQVDAAVKALAEKNPTFKAGPVGPPRGGSDLTGATPAPPKERPRSLVEALKRRQ
jgi:hypothetical protein